MVIISLIPKLAQKKIILASASPRRQELLRNIGLKTFEAGHYWIDYRIDLSCMHAYGSGWRVAPLSHNVNAWVLYTQQQK